MVGLCLICSCCEYAYLVSKWSKFAAKHSIKIAREKVFGICRYEDDLVFLSKQICHRCAIVIVTDIYHGEIRFELNDDHHRHCHDKTFDKFLDSDLEATFEKLDIDPHKTNSKHVETGLQQDKHKFRFGSPMYPLGNCLDRLVSNIQNRKLRWSQLGLSVQQATNAFIYGHIEIQNLGYSKQFVRRAYNKSISHDPFFSAVVTPYV